MIPIQLTIEGLYSYQKRQSIDFTELTDAGLFGIFGEVGSGKSSLLEAISFALYGETERMNSREKRSYNMMNLKSNRMYIEFDFFNHENRKFRATREFRRNTKRFDDVKNYSTVFYEFQNENWIPLEHQNTETILGLSYSNFKRTIIIPQGQFKEFIELGAADRTKMMKEIFGLHRFDLQDKTGILRSKTKSKLDQLEGKLDGFEKVDTEILSEKEDELTIANKTLQETQKEHDSIEKTFQKMESVKLDFENLQTKKNDLKKLENQKIETDKKQKEIDEYELIFNTCYLDFTEQKKLEIQKNELEEKLKIEKGKLDEFKKESDELKEKLLKIQADYEILNEEKSKVDDLSRIIQILKSTKNIKTFIERSKKGLQLVEEKEKEEKSLKLQLTENEEKIQEKQNQLISSELLIEVGNWFSKLKLKTQNIENQKKKIKEWQLKFNEKKEKLAAKNYKSEDFEQEFHQKNTILKEQKTNWELQKSHWEVQQKLAEYAHELHDGKACPLCGSLEHPNIAGHSDETENLSKIYTKLQEIEKEIDKNQKDFNAIQLLLSEQKSIENQIEQENDFLKQLENEWEKHQKSFCWPKFKPNDYQGFELRKNQNAKIEKEKNDFIQENSEKRKKLEIIQTELKKYNDALIKFREEEAILKGEINQNINNLKVLKWIDFSEKPIEIVQTELNQLHQKNQLIEKNYQEFQSKINELNPKISAQEKSIELYEENQKILIKNLIQIQESIQQKLEKSDIDSLEKIQEILSLNLNTSMIRKEIQTFRITYESLKNSILELEEKLKNTSFDEEEFEQEKEKLTIKKGELKEINEHFIRLKTDLTRLKKLYEEKK
ncbi:MAG: SMC family ATPase, partial [Weeksellaceae bacterium]|nr:SMC family ATPase [Weeksellaceae bacterium]